MIRHRRSVLVGTFALALFILAGGAWAQDWPTRPVTMVVPYAAGGPVDTIGRITAAGLSEVLGQQVVIENVAGAGGMTGASRAAKAAPDGYTFLLGGLAVLGLVPNLYKKPLYDPVTDFAPISLFADSARILIARKDLPVNTLTDFIAYAKTNQAQMQFGSSGAGSGLHVCAVLLDRNGHHHRPCTLSRQCPRHAGPARRSHRFHVRADFHRFPPDQGRSREGHRDARAGASPGTARFADRAGAGSGRSRLQHLECFRVTEADARSDRTAARASDSEVVALPLVRERLASVGVTVAARERRSPEYLAQFMPSELAKWAGPIRASGVSAD